jgi:RES domain-containing protein
MKLKPNPRYEVFLEMIKTLKRPFVRWNGLAFRATPLPYANAIKLLDGKGSMRIGGRWSASGTFPAVNLATTQECALKESAANFTYYNFAPSDVRPKVIVGVKLKLLEALNLVNLTGLRRHLLIDLTELLAEDWRKVNDSGHESQSQAFGRAAHDSGAEAILTPSSRVPGGVNLVYFPEKLRSGSLVEILGEADLDRWLKLR